MTWSIMAGVRNIHDHRGKKILTRALSAAGHVLAEHEVIGPAQAVDVWFRPDPERADMLKRAGLLGRMSGGHACMIEPYSKTPGIHEMHSCLCKQYALHHQCVVEARQEGEPRPPLPRLWLVSPGRPETLIADYEYQAIPEWPPGCYRAVPLVYNHGLIVLSELPSTRETLLVRLLGRETRLMKAVAELFALPDDAWEKHELRSIMVDLVPNIPKHLLGDDMEAEEYLRDVEARYEEWNRRTRNEGRRAIVHDQLEQRFGVLPPNIRARLDEGSTEELQMWSRRLLTANTLASVFAD